MKTNLIGSLFLGILLFFSACSSDSSDDSANPADEQFFEIKIGSAAPISFSGSSMKLDANTYQLSGNADDDSGLSITIMWQSDEPTGTLNWNASLENNQLGNWMLMANGGLTKSYYSYNAEDGAVTANSSGSLVIEEFGNVEDFVEGTFELDNAYYTAINGSEVQKSNVRVTGNFKVKREL